MRHLIIVALALLAGCEQHAAAPVDAADAPAALGDPGAPDDAGAAALLPGGDVEAVPAAAKPELPQGWQGQGLLASRSEKPPRGAPKWARVLAEVVEKNGQRYLQTTGRVEGIKNKPLARTTAENRARAEMTRWVASERLVGSEITDVWQHPKSGITLARAAMAVPETWVPGSPLPAVEPPPAP